MEPRKAIIIGGGIGGLTAGLALHRAGYQVAIYEQAPELREVGAGLTVWPNAMKALRSLGVAELVWALGRPFGVGRIYDWRGRVLVEGARREILEERFGWPGTVLHRHRLLDALGAFLPGGVLHLGRRCTGLRQDSRAVTVSFADGSSADADLVIGADGLNSVVRTHILGAGKPRYAGYVAYRGITPFDLDGDIAYESWGIGQRFGFVPGVGREVYWWAALTLPAGLNPPAHSYKSELLERYKGWFAPIEEVIRSTPDQAILRNDIFDRPTCAGWSNGRITLLGDAAHPVTPDLGQGACLAFEDAVVLARCLQEEPDVPSALRRYEARRLRRVRFINQNSRLMGFLGQCNRGWQCTLRNGLVRFTPTWAALLWLGWQFRFSLDA